MNQLTEVKIEKNPNYGLVVSSRVIANELGKEHKNVLRDLDNIISTSSDLSPLVIPSEYVDSKGESRREYLLTKDGFTLYMFNIQGYNDFKMAYINKFNEMEKTLSSVMSDKDKLLLNIIKSASELELATNLNKYEVDYVKPLEIRAEKAEEMVEHKTQVISHLTDNIKLQTKRQFLNEIIRMKGNKNGLISDRWGLLYKFYEKQTKMNLSARLEAYNLVNKPKLSSKLELIDKVLNDIDTLYAVAVKTFESDFKSKLQKYLDLL